MILTVWATFRINNFTVVKTDPVEVIYVQEIYDILEIQNAPIYGQTSRCSYSAIWENELSIVQENSYFAALYGLGKSQNFIVMRFDWKHNLGFPFLRGVCSKPLWSLEGDLEPARVRFLVQEIL